jgi:hypothetical protein
MPPRFGSSAAVAGPTADIASAAATKPAAHPICTLIGFSLSLS